MVFEIVYQIWYFKKTYTVYLWNENIQLCYSNFYTLWLKYRNKNCFKSCTKLK